MKKKIFNKLGYTAAEILIVASIVGLIPMSVYMDAYKRVQSMTCLSNLRNIYIGVQMYEMDYGMIPDIQFYPESITAPKSIANVLAHYIDDNSIYMCSVMPDDLKKKKITYIWNDAFNNKRLYLMKDRSSKWLMTEMTAVKPEIPPPHRDAYNILFLDGHFETDKRAVHLNPTPAHLRDNIESIYVSKKDQ